MKTTGCFTKNSALSGNQTIGTSYSETTNLLDLKLRQQGVLMGQKKTVYSLAVYGLVLGKKPTQIRSQGSLQRRNQKPKSKKVKTSDYIYLKKFNHTQKKPKFEFPAYTSKHFLGMSHALALGYFP